MATVPCIVNEDTLFIVCLKSFLLPLPTSHVPTALRHVVGEDALVRMLIFEK